jgi:hypothetical protein
MIKTSLLLFFVFSISTYSHANNSCACKDLQKSNPDQQQLIRTLEKTDFEFEADIVTNSVRGVVGARYFYCEDDKGFLIVQLDDKELLYKNVPLQIWFEFKFTGEYTSFYTEHIKYDFISI